MTSKLTSNIAFVPGGSSQAPHANQLNQFAQSSNHQHHGIGPDGVQGLPAPGTILHSSIASSIVSNAGALNHLASMGNGHENPQASQAALLKAKEPPKKEASQLAQHREANNGSKMQSHGSSMHQTHGGGKHFQNPYQNLGGGGQVNQ